MNPYNHLIKLGRILKDHKTASELAEQYPSETLGCIESIDRQMRFTKVSDFFSLFPPIKRYADDGVWDYKSTLSMIEKRLGTHFGKDDFKHLLMSECYENKFVHLVGYAFMCSISRIHKQRTGTSAFEKFFAEQGVRTIYLSEE